MLVKASPSMSAIDFFWHLSNLFAVSALFGLTASAGAKLFWRRRFASASWLRLAAAVGGSAALVTAGGLLAFGRDGRIATYALMTAAGALALAWVGIRARG